MSALLNAARARCCRVQVGSDLLFEQIPASLEFFDLPSITANMIHQHPRLIF